MRPGRQPRGSQASAAPDDHSTASTRPITAAAGEVQVPRGRFYLLGDHRDAVRDSRLSPAVQGMGFVAESQVIGRVDLVIASSAGAPWWDPRGWRGSRVLEGVR